MSSIKRIYLACRIAIAEAGLLPYVLAVTIMAVISVFIFLVSGDESSTNSLLKSQFSFWNSDTISSIIVISGWIASLIICDGFFNRWFKEENQAIRTLSLPLSNGERSVSIFFLYLVYIPVVSLLLPLLVACLITFLAPDFLMLPSPAYFWVALPVGIFANLIACTLWAQPAFAFGKKGGYFVLVIFAIGITYVALTHGTIQSTVDLPYVASSAVEDGVVGLTRYEPQMTADGEVIRIEYDQDEVLYVAVQTILLLIMLAAGSLALTKKTT